MVETDQYDTSGWIAGHDPLNVIRLTDPLTDDLG